MRGIDVKECRVSGKVYLEILPTGLVDYSSESLENVSVEILSVHHCLRVPNSGLAITLECLAEAAQDL